MGYLLGYLPDPNRIEVLDAAMVEVLRQKTIAERVEMVFAANRTVRLIIEGGLRTRHPEMSDDEIQAVIARRMCPELQELEEAGLLTRRDPS